MMPCDTPSDILAGSSQDVYRHGAMKVDKLDLQLEV